MTDPDGQDPKAELAVIDRIFDYLETASSATDLDVRMASTLVRQHLERWADTRPAAVTATQEYAQHLRARLQARRKK